MDNLISQGVELAILGMGIVFLFLGLLVLVTSLMSTCILRYYPVSAPEVASASGRAVLADKSGVDPELIAVITAAVAMHRVINQ